MTTKAKSRKPLADLLETSEQVRDVVAAVITHLAQTDGAGRTVARRLELMLIKATQSILAPEVKEKAREITDPKPEQGS